MTLILFISVTLGFFMSGLLVDFMSIESYIIEPILVLMIFFSGLSIGYSVDIRETFRKIGGLVFLTPTLIIIGSIAGAYVVGRFIEMSFYESSAVASGLGWYSISAIIIGQHDAYLSAFSLLSNILRELLAFVLVPIVAKYVGYIEAIGPSASTSLDTTLPCIISNTDEKTGLLAFTNGMILIMLIPMLVQFFVSLQYA